MDEKGIAVIREHALKIYPDTGEVPVDYEIQKQRDAYVKGFVDGVDWYSSEVSKAIFRDVKKQL